MAPKKDKKYTKRAAMGRKVRKAVNKARKAMTKRRKAMTKRRKAKPRSKKSVDFGDIGSAGVKRKKRKRKRSVKRKGK